MGQASRETGQRKEDFTCMFLRTLFVCSMQLTDRQQQVFDYIKESQRLTGVTPSTRDIQEHFGFSSQTAAVSHLKALEKKGAIRRLEGKARDELDRLAVVDDARCRALQAELARRREHAVRRQRVDRPLPCPLPWPSGGGGGTPVYAVSAILFDVNRLIRRRNSVG